MYMYSTKPHVNVHGFHFHVHSNTSHEAVIQAHNTDMPTHIVHIHAMECIKYM